MRYRVLSGLALLWSVGCGGGGGNLSAPPPPEVTVAEVMAEELEDWDEYQGEFEAVDAVDIQPRVRLCSPWTSRTRTCAGHVFANGPSTWATPRTTSTAAGAALAEDQGGAAVGGRGDLREEQDTRLTLVSEARAAVQAAEAAVRAAELDLGYTRVRSPVAGRTSRAEVTEGNLVTGGPAGSTLLTTIVSIDPIYVYFEGDEAAYLRYAHLDQQGERPSSRRAANPVQIGLADEQGFPHRGQMDFVDNRLDRQTGTIRARAVMPIPTDSSRPACSRGCV